MTPAEDPGAFALRIGRMFVRGADVYAVATGERICTSPIALAGGLCAVSPTVTRDLVLSARLSLCLPRSIKAHRPAASR